MLYLYGIIDQQSVEFALPRGLDDTELSLLPSRGMGLVTGVVRCLPVRNAANAQRHMDVLTTLISQCTVLPARFGAIFDGNDDLEGAISELRAELAADLQRLRGQIEVAIRVTERRPLILKPVREGFDIAAVPDTDMGPGIRYITTKRAENEQRRQLVCANESIAGRVTAALSELITGQGWQPLISVAGRAGISAEFLLPRERLEAFKETLETLRRAETGLDILWTGPWPPYSFVGSCTDMLADLPAHSDVISRIAS